MFDRYFPLMKALNVDLLSRRHKFSLIAVSSAVAKMVSPTRITLALTFFLKNASLVLSVIVSVFKTSFDVV